MITLIIIGWLVCGVIGMVAESYIKKENISTADMLCVIAGPLNLLYFICISDFKIKTPWGPKDKK